MAAAGVSVTHAPGCDVPMGWGIAPAAALADAGVAVGLGTSGGGSNDAGHLLADARLALQVAPLVGRPVSAGEVLGWATAGSAAGLGRPELGISPRARRRTSSCWDVSGRRRRGRCRSAGRVVVAVAGAAGPARRRRGPGGGARRRAGRSARSGRSPSGFAHSWPPAAGGVKCGLARRDGHPRGCRAGNRDCVSRIGLACHSLPCRKRGLAGRASRGAGRGRPWPGPGRSRPLSL